MAKRKCKLCGRRFESKGPGDVFCSPLCKTTGFFCGGGGDTSKPGVATPAPSSVIPQPKPARVRKDDERFARVRLMFEKPPAERWAIAKDFNEEEKAFAKRMAKRMMMEEDRLTREWEWDGRGDEPEEVVLDSCGGGLGDSDDGSI